MLRTLLYYAGVEVEAEAELELALDSIAEEG
jgi:hypothetical protein